MLSELHCYLVALLLCYIVTSSRTMIGRAADSCGNFRFPFTYLLIITLIIIHIIITIIITTIIYIT